MSLDQTWNVNLPSPFGARYQPLHLLGRGGGGEVWAARDRVSSATVAIKALHPGYDEAEAEALIRETTTLSGLEGLGFPRVLELGRASDGRLFLVRELVEGESFAQLAQEDPRRALSLLCAAADVLAVVHRAGLLHGDIKPANMIVRPGGDMAFVDLGLASALREGGGTLVGLTPHYAAPEVRSGESLSVQSEVFSLGVILRELLDDGADLELSAGQSERLVHVAARATKPDLTDRYPSADEFGQALRVALSGDAALRRDQGPPWPVLGISSSVYAIKRLIDALAPGGCLVIGGPPGSGYSTLMRRICWQEAVRGRAAVFMDEQTIATEFGHNQIDELSQGALLILDGAVDSCGVALDAALQRGVRIIRPATGDEASDFEIPPLDEAVVRTLLQGALISMPEQVVAYVIERVGARPGPLRRFVAEAQGVPVMSNADVDQILTGTGFEDGTPEQIVEACLERGHFVLAQNWVAKLDEQSARGAWLVARYELAAGSCEKARDLCVSAAQLTDETQLRERLSATLARAHLGLGQYETALLVLEPAEHWHLLARAEGYAYRGLSLTLLARHEEAKLALEKASAAAQESGSARLIALSCSALATSKWRAGDTTAAILAYHAAIDAARRVGDSGMLASSQINLAGLMKERGDLAVSIELLEAAVDAARRAGRTTSLKQALLNLTNSDLYLGRLERARMQMAQVGDPKTLPAALAAQFHGLQAELLAREDEIEESLHEFAECRKAWEDLGRRSDAAEAALEACLVAASATIPGTGVGSAGGFVPSAKLLDGLVEHGKRLLDDQDNALLVLAQARSLDFSGRSAEAEQLVIRAKDLAKSSGKREWLWRACALYARILDEAGKRTRAARVTEEAIEVLEEIGARLPQDLREVYWSEPRRRALRARGRGEGSFRPLAREALPHHELTSAGPGFVAGSGADAISRMTMTPLERRLARVLAINSDLAGEVDLGRLSTKIIAHACELLAAERGYLLLGEQADKLRIFASRGGQGSSHEEFSRSIAQEVLSSGRPLVSVDAPRDQRIQAFQSVHLAAVAAVACVPILAPKGLPIGALYIETRTGARPSFGQEVPTLQAFADQAAIAIESARVLSELQAKSEALSVKNLRLSETRARLKAILGKRTARLREVKNELKTTREQMSTHAAYGQMVGQSEAMRKIYALIERIKDTNVPVLITGESGTGKEVAARAISEGSARAAGRMLAVNCGAIPETILESELFGHVRGAFTGADRDRKGLFREADGGVLFLDEIGEMPLKMQTSLLRVLQEKKVRPVGGANEASVDVRVIFATNRDLNVAVEQGQFREDLLYRIQVVELALPPLRDRQEDIPLLCDHFLNRFAQRFGSEKKTLSRAAMDRLMSYSFPGNIRQLENILLSAWVLSEDDVIELVDLRLDALLVSKERKAATAHAPMRGRNSASSHHRTTSTLSRKGTLSEHERAERKLIVQALESTGWNRVKAAKLLDMPRRTFYRRLKEYGIQ